MSDNTPQVGDRIAVHLVNKGDPLVGVLKWADDYILVLNDILGYMPGTKIAISSESISYVIWGGALE